MKNQLNKQTLVIGAGGGGIASALLASARGENVTLVESHSALGGCASYFKRGPFTFDAGATTISGIEVGRPLGELFELLGSSPELHPADPGITFHLSCGKVLSYHRDFELWLSELTHHFPGLDHRPFWTLIHHISKKSWSLLKDIKTFPFVKTSDLTDVFKHPQYVALIPYLFLSTDHILKKYGLDHPDYLELINGILIISAQAHSDKIPFIVGAMALSYPSETYAPVGGMKGLMDFFEKELNKRHVIIKKKTKVEKIFPQKAVLQDGTEILADRLIVNIPIWNMAQMSEGKLHSQLNKEAYAKPGSWGALTLYFGIKADIKAHYHQVHLKKSDVPNYFISFSVPGDLLRAPAGYQSVSISIHVKAEDSFDQEKHRLAKIIMDDFLKRFPVSDVKNFTIGTPKTFERYTGRKMGFVGGLPFLYGSNPLSMLSPLTVEESIFRVGDTIFPGQGLCGVVAGAMQLHHRLSK